MTHRPVIAISAGCPCGVGPEVAVAAAARAKDVRPVLVCDLEIVRRAARSRRVPESHLVAVDGKQAALALAPGQVGVWIASTSLTTTSVPCEPQPTDGAAQLAWIDEATDLVRAGIADAIATGPVSKLAIASSGAPGAARFRGHTEHIAARVGAREVVMAFRSEALATALVTTHLPLAKVPAAVTRRAVATSTYWLARLLIDLGVARPKIAIAGLNPHAGEGGLLGTEEKTRIAPGIELARRRLAAEGLAADFTGPLGAETAYRLAVAKRYDAVVAMYHDQATIPMKVLGFGEAVNVTLGLPLVRTSVDHGTGYDIAWKGTADPRGMLEAIALAATLAQASSSRRG